MSPIPPGVRRISTSVRRCVDVGASSRARKASASTVIPATSMAADSQLQLHEGRPAGPSQNTRLHHGGVAQQRSLEVHHPRGHAIETKTPLAVGERPEILGLDGNDRTGEREKRFRVQDAACYGGRLG